MQSKTKLRQKKDGKLPYLSASQPNSVYNRVFINSFLLLSTCLSESQWQYLAHDLIQIIWSVAQVCMTFLSRGKKEFSIILIFQQSSSQAKKFHTIGGYLAWHFYPYNCRLCIVVPISLFAFCLSWWFRFYTCGKCTIRR